MAKVQINFYGILTDQYSNILIQLLAKATAIEKESLIITSNKEDVDLIDDALWRSGTFWLPHCYINNKLQEHNPIVISTIDDYLIYRSDISNKKEYLFLINPDVLTMQTYLLEFTKVFILFCTNYDRILLNIRTLWKELSKDDSYYLVFYQQNKSGKFELKTDTHKNVNI